ncbi:hypothetical protein QOM21_14625 [Streptomyces sp. Pv4-95]|uniref:hypothetical protein n=1 Tax=Streptomyces sp. Pv4-95 TaxID=3049543 RepID=UPI003891CEB7
MTTSERVEEIAFDSSLSVSERSQRITETFSEQGAEGPDLAVSCLLKTTDEAIAEYAAAYLELVPGNSEAKTRAAERLRGAGALASSAARLVPWLPESLIDAFIDDFLSSPGEDSPLSSVIFSIGVYHPDLLRPHAGLLGPTVRPSLLSGAPDTQADALLNDWHRTGDGDNLQALALIRTPHAADLIASVRAELDSFDDWEWLMPLAGRLPDTGSESGFTPSFMGFVTARGESPHVMGGRYAQDVPLCVQCNAPADRVLTLSARDMPQTLSRDPSFFWFSCDCDEVDILTVRFTDDATYAYFQPQGPAAESSRVVPGERSMTLERHPNQTGVSRPAVAGLARHQVGGLPRWPSPETHPYCPECGNFMPFLAAVDSGPTPFGPMSFPGSLFGFWCDHCSVSTTRSQI